MEQNIIAVIWDFDKTLVNGYMQKPLFERFGVDEKAFWEEVNRLQTSYQAQGIRINPDTVYLNHLITCTKQGIFKGLNNQMFFDMGKELAFYSGIPEIFDVLKQKVSQNSDYQAFDIKVEHYVVSTGLAEMIRGSSIYDKVDGIWGCEFIERPIASELKGAKLLDVSKEIEQIAYTIDHTTKTRALFEINKGANKFSIDVNAKMAKEDRRVPFEHMIYIADGPSDVPAFSVITQNGGKALAVYPKGSEAAMEQVSRLLDDGRVNLFSEADYSEGTTTRLWLSQQVDHIANKIYKKKKQQIDSSASKAPGHLD